MTELVGIKFMERAAPIPESIEEDRELEMVIKVNLQETLDRLKNCPACGSELMTYTEYPQERICAEGCGDFTIADVYGNGDVVLAFRLLAKDEKHVETEHIDTPVNDA